MPDSIRLTIKERRLWKEHGRNPRLTGEGGSVFICVFVVTAAAAGDTDLRWFLAHLKFHSTSVPLSWNDFYKYILKGHDTAF